MNTYFWLRYVTTSRKLKEMGFIPALAYSLIAGLFVLISVQLFEKTDYAQYIYPILPLAFLPHLSERQRNDCLKTLYFKRTYRVIRLIENLALIFPFVLFLVWKHCELSAVLLVIIASLQSLYISKPLFSFALPTPFSRHPFEFNVGFRHTFFLFFLAYYVTIMSIIHDNFNLGIASLGLVFVIMCTFFLRSDHEQYVWIFNLSPSHFLNYKVRIAIRHSLLLCAPILFLLSIFYPTNSWIVGLIFLVGCAFLSQIIYAKYAAFPNDIGIGELVLFGLSIFFPPLMLVLIIYFRNKAIQKLNTILK